MIEVAGRDEWRRVEKGWAIAEGGPSPGRYAVSRKAMRPTAAVKNGVGHLNVEGAASLSTGR